MSWLTLALAVAEIIGWGRWLYRAKEGEAATELSEEKSRLERVKDHAHAVMTSRSNEIDRVRSEVWKLREEVSNLKGETQ